MDPELIGRSWKFDRVLFWLVGALHVHGSIVMVKGEAGLGRTRSSLECSKLAEISGQRF